MTQAATLASLVNSNSFKIPTGTTAERPTIPEPGLVRFNTSDKRIEIYNGDWWDSPSLLFQNNIFSNPTDIFAWCSTAGASNCTFSRDTSTVSPFKNSPLKMVVTGNDPYISTYNSPTWNIAPAAAGQKWQVRVFAKASVSTLVQLFLFAANSSGAYFGGPAVNYPVSSTWNEYVLEYTYTDPATAYIQIRLDGPDAGGSGASLWFDGLQVRRLT